MSKTQRGVTLIELILVIGLLAAMTTLSFYEKQSDLELARARIVGGLIFQYNNAVRESLANNIPASSVSHSGTSWLKSSACGGVLTPGQEYLPCSFPLATAANPVPFGNLSFDTTVAVSGAPPNRTFTATTSTSAFRVGESGGGMKIRADLSGVAVLSAASAIGGGVQAVSGGGSSPIAATTDARFNSNPLTGVITFVSSNNAANDVWLRTDGGNNMHKSLIFDAAADADRQITGASRIQNLAGQALFLGAGSGMAAMTAAIVVMDGNAEVLGDFRIRNHMQVDGNANVLGNAVVSGRISASGEIVSNSYIHANTYVYGQLFMDSNDNNYYVDPAGVSHMNVIYARSIGDKDNGAFYLDPNATSRVHEMVTNYAYASVFYDLNNTGYYVQPSFTSRLNVVASNTIVNYGRVTIGEYLQLDGVANEGWGCAPSGLQGRDPWGKLLSCVSGIWRSPAGGTGNYTTSGWYSGAVGFVSGARPMLIQVSGGSDYGCGGDGPNRYSLIGFVGGRGVVAQAVNANYAYTKTGFITFGVPANTYYEVQSFPYDCNPGTFTIWGFEL